MSQFIVVDKHALVRGHILIILGEAWWIEGAAPNQDQSCSYYIVRIRDEAYSHIKFHPSTKDVSVLNPEYLPF